MNVRGEVRPKVDSAQIEPLMFSLPKFQILSNAARIHLDRTEVNSKLFLFHALAMILDKC